MELRQVDGLFKPVWHNQPLDKWSADLKRVCGSYNAVPLPGRSRVLGSVECSRICGVDFAHVVKDLAAIERGRKDINRDSHEFLFLIIQLAGVGGVDQLGRQSLLHPGDCILVDSARPSSFVFEGRFSNQLSVHLPRQLMVSGSPVRFAVSTRLDRRDPMATTIRSLIAKMMLLELGGRSKAPMGSLLFETIRYAFEFDEEGELAPRLAGPSQRAEYAEELIDRNLTEPELGPAWLAARLDVPLRRIQEDFQQSGVTISSLIRAKRLTLAAEKLQAQRGAAKKVNIAQIAFASGFNDISYFNRSFREVFGVTPSEYLRSPVHPHAADVTAASQS